MRRARLRPAGAVCWGLTMAEDLKKEPSGTSRSSSRDADRDKEQKVSFQEFVYLMSSQALIQLGSVPNPVSGKVERSLPAAQHAIEILAMLEQKTKGNLTDEESEALASALYNLRMRYVQAVEAERNTSKKSKA